MTQWFHTAIADAQNVNKEALRDGLETNVAAVYTLAELQALTSGDLRAAIVDGVPYSYDPADTTTADDDGETCIVTADGNRFKTGVTSFYTQRSELGAKLRSIKEKLKEDIPTVLDFDDVDPTGATDSTDGINKALDAGGKWWIPDGTYDLDGILDVTENGTKLIGFGPGTTILRATSNNLPILRLANGVNKIELGQFTLDRTPTAISGGNGLTCLGSVSQSKIHSIIAARQSNGFYLGPTDWSVIEKIITEKNQGAGFAIVTIGSDGQLQWQLDTIISQLNVQQGYLVQAASGPSQANMGEWRNVASYANSATGVAVIGLSGVPIHNFRMSGFFHGENGSHNIYLDTYGSLHRMAMGTAELAGQSSTGPTQATPASGTGNGIHITANNIEVEISNVARDANSLNGLESSATHLVLLGGRDTENGQASSAGNRNGVKQVAGKVSRAGGSGGNNSGSSQEYGMYFTTDPSDGHLVSGVDLTGNGVAPIGSAVALVNAVIQGCQPASINRFTNANGVAIADSDSSHNLRLKTDSNLTTDRNLKFNPGDAARTVTLIGDPTLGNWFDQDVKTTALPTFAGATFSGNVNLNNDVPLKAKDSGGTARQVAKMNSSNNMVLGDTAGITSLLVFAGGGTQSLSLTSNTAFFPTISTTASAANAFLDGGASNQLLRSTSSAYYKRDIEDLEHEYADALLRMRPVWYRSKAEHDNPAHSWYGLIAEDVAKIDPRLVHWAYRDTDFDVIDAPDGWREVEETDDEGNTRIVREHDGRKVRRLKAGAVKVPDGVTYDRLTVLLLSIVQRQEARIAALEAKLGK